MSIERLVSEARRLLAAGRFDQCASLLLPALSNEARVGPGHSLCLSALITLGRYAEASDLLDRALSLEIAGPDAHDALAFHAGQLDRAELSNGLYRKAAELAGSDAQLWYNLAASERSLGRLGSAAEACDEALRHEPDRYPAILLRSEMRRATAEANHVDYLQARLAAEPNPTGRMFIAYALGKELHDLDRYDGAFEAFAEGAALRRRALRYDVAADEHKLERIASSYPAAGDPDRADLPRARHIFIVGLPRSGTTLTERILGSLSDVRSNGETEIFSQALLHAAAAEGIDIFDRCARGDHRAVAERYEQLASRGRPEGSIIEKLPMNYLYLGAIARALPAARVIWVRRHPVDSCFAMYRTLFGEAYPFSYAFDDLARYYVAYARLMDHWTRTIPNQIYPVNYEDLVERPAAVGAALAAHCGLEWNDEALDITRNTAASWTASAAQVREPIYSRSAGLWRKYEAQLEPLVARLRAGGIRV